MTIPTSKFLYYPDWANGFSISYFFETVIFTSAHDREQRSCLRSIPSRRMTFSLWEQKDVAIKVLNFIRANYQQSIAVPVYTELTKLTTSGDIYGIFTFATQDTSHFYNMSKLSGLCLFIDMSGIVQPFLTTVSSVSATSLNVADAYPYHVLGSNIAIYPAVSCFSDAPVHGAETDNLLNIDLTFNEKEQLWQ